MIVAGCDVGALTAKAVVMENRGILGSEIMRVRPNSVLSATGVMDRLLRNLDLSYDDIDRCVGTGYGRVKIPFAQANISEVSCHGMGAFWLVPGVRTIIDGGGQDYKVLKVDEKGLLTDFRMTGKCAAGTGKAMEIMAESLGVDISELGELSLTAANPLDLRDVCSVMTIIKIKHQLLLKRADTAAIAAGITMSAARQVMWLADNVNIEKEIAITGGIAKNSGVVKHLKEMMAAEFVDLPADPQIIGAIGAAAFAADQLTNPDSWKVVDGRTIKK